MALLLLMPGCSAGETERVESGMQCPRYLETASGMDEMDSSQICGTGLFVVNRGHDAPRGEVAASDSGWGKIYTVKYLPSQPGDVAIDTFDLNSTERRITIRDLTQGEYLSLKNYLQFLEDSLVKGMQWTIFEPNGEVLWTNVRRTVSQLLLGEWRKGALKGDSPEKAFFVRCDRATMDQNDIDTGRLICWVGLALVQPGEFLICRFGQFTAGAMGR
jgi:hypothetical protein